MDFGWRGVGIVAPRARRTSSRRSTEPSPALEVSVGFTLRRRMSPKTSVGFVARPGRVGVSLGVAAVLLGGCGATSESVSDASPTESKSESPGTEEAPPSVVSLGADDYGVNPGLCDVVDTEAAASRLGLELVVSAEADYEPQSDTWGTAAEPNVRCDVKSAEMDGDGDPVFYGHFELWISESADDAESLRDEVEDMAPDPENLETVDGDWDSGTFDWLDGRDDEAGNIGFLTGTRVQQGSAVLSCSTVWFAPEETEDPKAIVRDSVDTLLTDALDNSTLG